MQTSQARLKKAAAVHQQKFDARFPSLVGTDMEYQWAGHLCLTHNGVSVTQELDKGLFSACVQNGLGATRGTLTGICAAEHSLQVKTEIGAFFDANKPARLLPPALIGKPVANALLRWREWRATNE
jgi:glycine/D-amino acid oxidase-like deaminating enzyme